MISNEQLNIILNLAEKASKGPWHTDPTGLWGPGDIMSGKENVIVVMQSGSIGQMWKIKGLLPKMGQAIINVEYVKAVSPEVISELMAELISKRSEVKRLRDRISRFEFPDTTGQ